MKERRRKKNLTKRSHHLAIDILIKLIQFVYPISLPPLPFWGLYGKFNEKNRLLYDIGIVHDVGPCSVTCPYTTHINRVMDSIICRLLPRNTIPESSHTYFQLSHTFSIFDADALRIFFSIFMKIQYLIETISHRKCVFILKIAFDFLSHFI